MIRYNVPMDDYRAHPGVSASDLKNMQRSPAYARLRPSSPSDAKDWGTAVHTAILEPELLHKRYAVDPESPKGGYPKGWRNTKAYEALRDDALARPGIVGLLTAEDMDGLQAVADRIRANKIGETLHSLPGHREASVFVDDPLRKLVRKCRPDWLIPGARMVVDVKTAADHRADAFARACLRYGYHLSAAYYLDTISTEIDVEHFVFLVVNSEAPHEVATYTLDRDSIEQGRADYKAALDQWQRCAEQDYWPGGSDEIVEIRLPEYGINYYQNGDDQWQ